MGGFFITFEGAEGCGKSTQCRLLAEGLRAAGRVVRELREPGGTPLAEEIRHTLKYSVAGAAMTPETELFLMNAARAQLVRERIRPALAAGEVVVCDRFHDSTMAYQGWGRGLNLAQVAAVVEIAVGPTRPDLTILLRVSPELSAARRRERLIAAGQMEADRFETEDPAFFGRVEQGFDAVAAHEPERVRAVDGSPPVEVVRGAIWAVVEAALGLKAAGGGGRASIGDSLNRVEAPSPPPKNGR